MYLIGCSLVRRETIIPMMVALTQPNAVYHIYEMPYSRSIPRNEVVFYKKHFTFPNSVGASPWPKALASFFYAHSRDSHEFEPSHGEHRQATLVA